MPDERARTDIEARASAPSDLSPEQALMVGILIARGHDQDEAYEIVRADRVTAYLAGAHLAPTLQQLADMALKVTTLYAETIRAGELPND